MSHQKPPREELLPGQVFTFQYPFVRSTFTEFDEEGSSEHPCWKPGVRHEMVPPEGGDLTIADARGHQQVTVVGTFKPGKFPERVFYTRKWIDPDGRIFGKNALRITTIQGFRSLRRGFRHDFEFQCGKCGDLVGSTPWCPTCDPVPTEAQAAGQ